MADYFKVIGRKKVYINPRMGRVDLTMDFTDKQALRWYKDPNFPYIKPVEGAQAILSGEKVDVILTLIRKASSVEEIEILKAAKPDSKKIQEFII